MLSFRCSVNSSYVLNFLLLRIIGFSSCAYLLWFILLIICSFIFSVSYWCMLNLLLTRYKLVVPPTGSRASWREAKDHHDHYEHGGGHHYHQQHRGERVYQRSRSTGSHDDDPGSHASITKTRLNIDKRVLLTCCAQIDLSIMIVWMLQWSLCYRTVTL